MLVCVLIFLLNFELWHQNEKRYKYINIFPHFYNIYLLIRSNVGIIMAIDPGLVFTKGLGLSQVLGLNPVLKLKLLSYNRVHKG